MPDARLPPQISGWSAAKVRKFDLMYLQGYIVHIVQMALILISCMADWNRACYRNYPVSVRFLWINASLTPYICTLLVEICTYSTRYPVDPRFNIILDTGMQAMIDLDLYQSGDSGNCILTEVIFIVLLEISVPRSIRYFGNFASNLLQFLSIILEIKEITDR